MSETFQDHAAKATESWLHLCQSGRNRGNRAEPTWLSALRDAGIARFRALGFPTPDHEDWRFTNLAPLARLHFRSAPAVLPGIPEAGGLARSAFAALDGPQLVFVNGRYAAGLSTVAPPGAGVTLVSLGQALANPPDWMEPSLGKALPLDGDPFPALNSALVEDGAVIHVPAGVRVSTPVRLLYLALGHDTVLAHHVRNLILLEAGAQLTVIESYLSLDPSRYFTNAVTESIVGERATLEQVKFQDESPQSFHIAALHSRLGRASRYSLHSFALGARLSRNNIRTLLGGEEIECVLNGLYLTRGDQLADHHMVVEHASPHCASHEYFNGILDDKSKGVFHGRILVRPEAQKTDAKQTNRNILLSSDATVDTKPQLEIYADDVKCTHGATIGQMDQEALFYMRARGIGLVTARRLLMHAFAGEIVDRVRDDSIRDILDRGVWDRLEQNPHIAAAG